MGKTAEQLGYEHASRIIDLIINSKIQVLTANKEELLDLPGSFGAGESDSLAIVIGFFNLREI